MDLILWRHAEAEDGGPDGARPLTSKGRKQAAKMAAWLEARVDGRTRVLSSPAVRALETARALRPDVTVVPALAPGVSPRALCEAAGWPVGLGTVVVVGHQPDLGRAAAHLLFGGNGSLNVKKGAIWWFRHKEGGEVVLAAVLSPELV